MRTYQILSILMVAVLICGCSKSYENVKPQETQLSITAGFAENDDTKTTLQGTDVYWEVGDEIKVFYGSGSGRFASVNTEETALTTFTGNINVAIGGNEGFTGGEYMWGLYPYRSDATYNGTTVTTVIPEQQIGKAGSFAKNMNISLAKSSNLALAFYNVCGGVRFSLTRDDITDVVFEGRNNEDIAGTIKIAFSEGVPVIQSLTNGQKKITLKAPNNGTFESGKWYYIVAATGTLTNGFKLTFNTATQYAELEKTSEVTVKRGIFGSVEDADEGLTYHKKEVDSVVVTLTHAGELSSILKESKNNIVSLEIIGDINGDDVLFFRKMPKLRRLSLVQANIVEGGEPFITYGESFSGDRGHGKWTVEDRYTIKNNASYLFEGMYNIEEIVLPSSLEDVGYDSFFACKSLREITIPRYANYSDHSSCTTFGCCYKLENIFVEEGNEDLISIDGCLYSKDKHYLWAVPCGRSSFTIPDFFSEYGLFGECFAQDNNLKEITILENSPKLKGFNHLDVIENFIVNNSNIHHSTNNGVLFTADGTKLLCYTKGRKDETYTIPKGTTSIGTSSFEECRSLKYITIPEGVTALDDCSFHWCTSLEQIDFPSTTQTIVSSFQGCFSLQRITCRASIPPELIGSFGDSKSLIEIIVPETSIEFYKKAPVWQDYADIIKPLDAGSEYGEKVSIYVPSFGSLKQLLSQYDTDSLTNLEITGNLNVNDFQAIRELDNLRFLDFSQAVCENNTIPNSAFKGMNRIKYILIPDSIQHIGDSAFSGCASLVCNLQIPSKLITIGAWAFMYCNKLKGMFSFPQTLTSIGYAAFLGCSGITGDLILPDNISIIEKATFADCLGLDGVLQLPKNLKRIEGTSGESTAFDNCKKLSGPLVLPEGLEYIGDGAFSDKPNLSGPLSIPSSVKHIGIRAFSNCSGLTGELIIPNSVSTIYESAFRGCTSFSSIILEETISDIRESAFMDCSSILTVTCKAVTPPHLGKNVFNNQEQNRYIYVPESSITNYKEADNWKLYADSIYGIK